MIGISWPSNLNPQRLHNEKFSQKKNKCKVRWQKFYVKKFRNAEKQVVKFAVVENLCKETKKMKKKLLAQLGHQKIKYPAQTCFCGKKSIV